MIKQAAKDGFKLLTINTDYPAFPPIEEQLEVAKSHIQSYPEQFAFASTFHMSGWDEPDWQEKTIQHLDSTFDEGAVAVKIWKNIGMDFRDKDSNLVMIDNPKFDTIFEHLKNKSIVLFGHQGEPKDCWLSFDEMMVKEVGEYFKEFPEYYMYAQPEMPSYEEQMNARNKMLEKNKDIVFAGAHLASLEWSVDRLAKFLDRFPNTVVDLAARMAYVKVQTIIDREKVRQFFIKYRDRILYATDLVQDPGVESDVLKNILHDTWVNDWKFLATDSIITEPDLENSFKGLQLPKDVIDKVYKQNAEKTFPFAWIKHVVTDMLIK